MARLTVVYEIPDGDPARADPAFRAASLLDHHDNPGVELVSAQWGDMLPEADDTPGVQIGDGNTQVNRFRGDRG